MVPSAWWMNRLFLNEIIIILCVFVFPINGVKNFKHLKTKNLSCIFGEFKKDHTINYILSTTFLNSLKDFDRLEILVSHSQNITSNFSSMQITFPELQHLREMHKLA